MKRHLAAIILSLNLAAGLAFASVGAGGASAAATMVLARSHQTRDLLAFRDFLNQNAGLAGALRSDPARVRDGMFRAMYPELQSWLDAHRPFAKRIDRHPYAVMKQLARLKR
jgi:hypothetical protein